MKFEDKMILLANLGDACREDPNFFSEAIEYMQRGVNSKIDELNEKVVKMECIAVAMHSKANEARHTKESKKWVDGIIDKYSDVNHSMDVKWNEN